MLSHNHFTHFAQNGVVVLANVLAPFLCKGVMSANNQLCGSMPDAKDPFALSGGAKVCVQFFNYNKILFFCIPIFQILIFPWVGTLQGSTCPFRALHFWALILSCLYISFCFDFAQ